MSFFHSSSPAGQNTSFKDGSFPKPASMLMHSPAIHFMVK